ncbi:hypothetical protein HDU67_004382, partial [Dinochytrium kinnereticum]
MSDADLHWNQSILMNVIATSGDAVLKHKAAITGSLDAQISKCLSFRGVRWAGKTLRYLLSSLTGYYPENITSFETSDWRNEDFMKNSYKNWGKCKSIYEAKVEWHIPSQQEVAFARELMEIYVPLCDKNIRAIFEDVGLADTSDKKRADSFELCRWLTIARYILQGSSALISPNTNSEDTSSQSASLMLGYDFKPWPAVEAGYLRQDHPDHQKILKFRETLGKLLDDVFAYLLSRREDDVFAIKALVKGVVTYLSNRGVEGWKVSRGLSQYRYLKGSSVDNGKRHPRFLLLQRLYVLHLNRLRLAFSHGPQTKLIEQLTLKLSDLIVSRYPDVRASAQDALGKIIAPYPQLKARVFNRLLDFLKGDATEDHIAEGVLQCMRKKTFIENFALREWEQASLLMDVMSRPLLEVK